MTDVHEMRVKKRNGLLEDVSFDKILNRVKKLGNEAKVTINFSALVMKIIDQLYDEIPTTKIDELTAEQCAYMTTQHLDYGTLAARIVISNSQKNIIIKFADVMDTLYNVHDIHKQHTPLLAEHYYKFICRNREALNEMIDHNRDYLIDYFGFKTLERAYLMKIGGNCVETIQYMWLRVSVGIHGHHKDEIYALRKIKETYDLMSTKHFTHATPTLFNSATPRPQLSSCFLQSMKSDSIDGIYETLRDCANISKWAGGIGLHIHNVRASGSHINGTNGTSNGIVPMLKVFNDTARYVDQGGGKRNGSFAIYIEPWHADIYNFLDLKKNHGDEEKDTEISSSIIPRNLSIKQVKEFASLLYNSKKKHDKKRSESGLPLETMEQHMYTFLNQRYGLKELILENAAAVIKATHQYKHLDNDVAVFEALLANSIDEDFLLVQEQVKIAVVDLLRVNIKAKW